MPQATEELRQKWRHYDEDGGDALAISFLKAQGYVLLEDWTWDRPQPRRNPTDKELSACCYLIEEWDFGGFNGYPPHVDT